MKKFTCLILIISCCLVLTSCFADREKTSFDEYVDHVNRYENGFSYVEIDHPLFWLPSISFLQDYSYIEGFYYWREDDALRGFFTDELRSDIALLSLKYDENVYIEAKDFMLQEIEPYEDKYYEYGSYIFYENSNFAEERGSKGFPLWFTMACYNDEKQTLCFLGFYVPGGTTLFDEKYLTDMDNNWEDFIDEFFGEYYDFSE